jgi:acyl-homoserine-lactone acylase
MVERCASARAHDDPPIRCAQALAPAAKPLEALAAAVASLEHAFGTWKKPWGEVNRYQRLPAFKDSEPSSPVPFTAGVWGSLASFATVSPPDSRLRYGTSGNSFVAVVELAPEGPRALAVTCGGESGDPSSRHFADQVERYASGRLRPVYFRPAELRGHTEQVVRPGERGR